MVLVKSLIYCVGPMALAGLTIAHGGDHQKPLEVDPKADWATRHLAEEHHISNFDAGAFFTLHDYDNNGVWDQDEIQTTYGLKDVSSKDVTDVKKDQVVDEILRLIDVNQDLKVSREEFITFTRNGGVLPDFGLGPGHHGDDEYEYEIHHWEKYHDENTKEEDLTHPEDIEHFKKHEEMEEEAERIAAMDKMPIVEMNIPKKFKKFP